MEADVNVFFLFLDNCDDDRVRWHGTTNVDWQNRGLLLFSVCHFFLRLACGKKNEWPLSFSPLFGPLFILLRLKKFNSTNIGFDFFHRAYLAPGSLSKSSRSSGRSISTDRSRPPPLSSRACGSATQPTRTLRAEPPGKFTSKRQYPQTPMLGRRQVVVVTDATVEKMHQQQNVKLEQFCR